MLLEKTQRRLCRLLFVVGCVLPTLAVGGYTAHRLGPGFDQALLAAAGDAVGVRITCDEVTTPRPGSYRLRGAAFIDPANAATVASCASIQLAFENGEWRFVASELTIEQPQAAGAWLGRVVASDWVAEGRIEGLSLTPDTRLKRVETRLAGAADSERVLRLRSDDGARLVASIGGGVSSVEADTAGHQAPAAWLPGCPLSRFGSGKVRFGGRFSIEMPHDGRPASGAAAGRFETESIATEHLASSRGQIEALDLAWRAGRLERFRGRLDLRDGQLSRPLVFGACQWLAMEPLGDLESRYNHPAQAWWFPFTQLACDVELDAAGLVLVAGCGEIDGRQRGGALAHAVVEHNGTPLLREPLQRPLPTQRLVQAWHPDDPAELPATAAALEMANRLPGAKGTPRR